MALRERNSMNSEKENGRSSERDGGDSTGELTLRDTARRPSQNEACFKTETDQHSTEVVEDHLHDLFLPLSLSNDKSKTIDSDQEALESAAQRQLLPKDKGKARAAEYRIKYDVYDMPDQSFAEDIIAQSATVVEHSGVSCDGPLCMQNKSFITGLRYKCTICENIDFCSNCVASFVNSHNARHAMVKCVLPTKFKVIRDLDDDSKRALLPSCGDTSGIADHLIHVVYAETTAKFDMENPSYIGPPRIRPISEPEAEETQPAMFVIQRESEEETKSRTRRWIEASPAPDHVDYVTSYRIDENANVSVKYQPMGKSPNEARDEGVFHHQDPELLMKILSQQILPYRYTSDAKFYRDVQAGRLATRVIDLKPGNFADKLECGIKSVDLSEAPSYEALSYTWKETSYERAHHSTWTKEVDETFRSMSKFSHAVYCGDSFLTINNGLRDALRRLRDPVETKTYWIDQLSIDQGNFEERAFQVQGMTNIYNKADRVVVWTGDEDEDTKPAFEIIRKLAMVRSISEELALAPEDLVADAVLDLPPLESSDWRSLLNFFLRPVFGRSWVIQEIVVAQHVIIRCGDETVPWAELASGAMLLSQTPWLNALPFRQFPKLQRNNELRLSHIIMINGFRNDFHGMKALSVETLVFNTGIFEATDMKDKIYSILGIRRAKIDPRSTTDIQVDYQKSTQEVFTEATKAIITEGASFNICGLNGSTSNNIAGLPSWVPDYTSNPTSVATSFSRPEPRGSYRASGDSELVSIWPYEDRPHLLLGSSYKAETIVMVAEKSISENDPAGPHIIEWTDIASRCGPNYVTGEFTPDAFWRTCVGDTTLRWRHSPAPESYHHMLATFFLNQVTQHVESSDELMRAISISPEAQSAVDSPASSGWGNIINKTLGTLLEDAVNAQTNIASHGQTKADPEAIPQFLATCRNRRFFLTTNNYLGIGPIDAQVGDEIHVLAGARVPFVFRKCVSDKQDCDGDNGDEEEMKEYSMIGESYVHGLMIGEALQREEFEWEGVCIR